MIDETAIFPRGFPWFKTLVLIGLVAIIGNYIYMSIERQFPSNQPVPCFTPSHLTKEKVIE